MKPTLPFLPALLVALNHGASRKQIPISSSTTMKPAITLVAALLLVPVVALHAAEPKEAAAFTAPDKGFLNRGAPRKQFPISKSGSLGRCLSLWTRCL